MLLPCNCLFESISDFQKMLYFVYQEPKEDFSDTFVRRLVVQQVLKEDKPEIRSNALLQLWCILSGSGRRVMFEHFRLFSRPVSCVKGSDRDICFPKPWLL